jgi:CubicO group peptidase (beta-lactamase class C family)
MGFIRQNLMHLSTIPKDLDSVITIDSKAEVNPAEVSLNDTDVQAIWDQVIDLYKTGTHPAISIHLRRHGKTFMSRSIGHAQGNGPHDMAAGEKTLVTPETPFCLFSTSKGITALLMHMLAEDGLINIMDPVAFYAPEFAQNGKGNITIHQILAHRGGIPGLPTDVPVETLWDEDKVWQLLCEAKPIVVDGSKLAYHAITGGFVLDQVVKRVTGGNMNAYVDKKIRKPMGMKYFTYGIEDKYFHDMAVNYATGPRPQLLLKKLVKRALGTDIEELESMCNDPRFQQVCIPAGNLVSTAAEASAFFQMMMDGGVWNGKRICKESTIARCIHEFGSRTFDRTLMVPMRYSAGLMLGDKPFGLYGPNTKHAFGHLGLINKFSWADPSRQLSASILTSGIPLLAPHIPALVKLLCKISNGVPQVDDEVKNFKLKAVS